MPYFPSGGLGLPIDLTGAVAATRYVGGTASGAPVAGTFAAGDFAIAQNGAVFVCTVAGTPGTWVQTGGAGSGLPAGGTVGQTILNSAAATGVWAGPPVEVMASQLVNATSTGDAGGRADHFLGSALSGAWSHNSSAGGITITVANSGASLLRTGASGTTFLNQPYTPSGAFRIEARLRLADAWTLATQATATAALYVSDSTASLGGNGFFVITSQGTNLVGAQNVKVNGGAQTGGNTTTQTNENGQFFYLALSNDGAGNFTGYASPDRVAWITIAGPAQACTVAVMGFLVGGSGTGGGAVFDFIDVVS